jgi:hypothetical protein
MSQHHIGQLVHAYAQAKWGKNPDKDEAVRIGAQLGREIKDRLDVLGADGECLLNAGPEGVMAKLRALESEALREDSLAERAAARRHVQDASGPFRSTARDWRQKRRG